MAKYFSRSEFACRCGCEPSPTVDFELLEVLDDVRGHFGSPLSINSGVRCEAHNAAVGGGSKSQHLLGRAADLSSATVSPHAVQSYLLDKYQHKYGIGVYDTFTHIDTRPNKARW